MKEPLAPLRKIIGTDHVPSSQYFNRAEMPGETRVELFECGHWKMPKQDFYGETNAYRRRCRKCLEGKPKDFEPQGEAK
jgi:hypothetical protein